MARSSEVPPASGHAGAQPRSAQPRSTQPRSAQLRRTSFRRMSVAALTSLSLCGCSGLQHFQFASRGQTLAFPSVTHRASTVKERLAQSGLQSKFRTSTSYVSPDDQFMIVSDSTSATTTIALGLRRAAQRAVKVVNGIDPKASHTPLLILVARTDREFSAWSGAKSRPDGLATTVTGGAGLPFIVLAPVTSEEPDSAVTVHTLSHEAFHALTLEHLVVQRPLWLIEGYAEYSGEAGAHIQPKVRDGVNMSIPTDAQLRGSDAPTEYFVAWSFVRYLVATYGRSRSMAFYTDAVTSRTPVSQLEQRYFGKQAAQLQTGFDSWYEQLRS